MLPFFAGLGAGLILSAPVGPMGLLAAFQATEGRLKAAYLLAVGVCAADALLALLATFGAGLPIPSGWLSGSVAALMMGLGIYLWMTAKRADMPVNGASGFGVGFMATLLHPANLLAFGVAFSWLHNQGLMIEGMAAKLLLVIGVFGGAMAMWCGLIHVAAGLGASGSLARFQVRFKQGLAVLCVLTGLWALKGFL